MSSELVTVATYPSAIEAHAARNCLEENEIEAFVADEYFSTLKFGNLSTSKLQVPVADVQRAKDVLSSHPMAAAHGTRKAPGDFCGASSCLC